MIKEENTTKDLKFYSQRTIGIATFIGGPMAAGYLIRENYRTLNESDNGKMALIIGIVSTVLLFIGIFSIPESVIDKIPNQLFPAIYTVLIYVLVEKIQGTILNQHRKNGNEFHSGWKATGIGIISLTILLIGILGFVYLSTDNALYDNYDKEMELFTKNETETLQFYNALNTRTKKSLLQELDHSILVKWEENIEIIEKTNAYENLPKELAEQNMLLIEYSELRLAAFKLLKKAIQEDTDKYASDLDEVHTKIDVILEKLD